MERATKDVPTVRPGLEANAQDQLTLSPPDGLVLGYAEYGSPNGFPILFFHGYPSSRLEARGIDTIPPAVICAWLRQNDLDSASPPFIMVAVLRTGRRVTTEARERFLAIAFEGFRHGADGFVQEALLLSQDFGFKLEDVTHNPIQIWHGTQDKNASLSMIRYTAQRLPHNILREFKGEDHCTMAKRPGPARSGVDGRAHYLENACDLHERT